ncbi:MAG: inositol monophosphatase family protein [Chloroflexota bacterium]
MPGQSELDVASSIAVEAGEVLRGYFGSDRMDVRAKGVGDVITAADLASERLVLGRLREGFPQDGVIGEEGSDIPSANGRLWAIDPLDATLNYSRGIPVWCVSLALFAVGEPVLGVIHDPLRGETFTAERGAGATCNGRPIRTSGITAAAEALVHATVDFHDHSRDAGIADLQAIAPHVLRTRNLGSAALGLAYIAAGRLDAMLHRYAHVWDYAAGVILIREAGGVVTSMQGDPYRVETESILAAASADVHASLLARVRSGADSRLE